MKKDVNEETKRARERRSENFPGILYLRKEDDGEGGHYFLADTDPEGEDGTAVAVYQLLHTKKLRRKVELE